MRVETTTAEKIKQYASAILAAWLDRNSPQSFGEWGPSFGWLRNRLDYILTRFRITWCRLTYRSSSFASWQNSNSFGYAQDLASVLFEVLPTRDMNSEILSVWGLDDGLVEVGVLNDPVEPAVQDLLVGVGLSIFPLGVRGLGNLDVGSFTKCVLGGSRHFLIIFVHLDI